MFNPHIHLGKYVLTAVMTCSMLLSAYAQPKSSGATFAFNGLGLVYEHDLKDRSSFLEVSVKAETSEYVLGRIDHPGLSASLVWNMTIKEWKSSEGNLLKFFAGPGAVIGYGADFRKGEGTFFGLKGRVGGECSFSRNVCISLSLSPVIGSHVMMRQGSLVMQYYKNGLIYGLVPEIGIRYRFR